MRRSIVPTVCAILALAASGGRAAADVITYEWDDEMSNSRFAGSFAVDTSRLLDAGGPGRLLTIDAVAGSRFEYSRASFGIPVVFQITGVSAGGIAIDPATGAVLTGGELVFGPSDVVMVGNTPYQLLGGRVELTPDYNRTGGQRAFVRDTTRPDEYLGSIGHWEVTVQPIPAPPAGVLGLAALACWPALRRVSRGRTTGVRPGSADPR